MGEYASFSGDRIKIGTCEDMYYLRASQRGMVDPLPGNVNVRSNEALGCRFRFPWPDEDNCQPGGFTGDFERAVAVNVPMPAEVEHYSVQFSARAGYLVSLPCPESIDTSRVSMLTDPSNAQHQVRIHRNGFSGAVKLVQQKLLADGRLVPVLQCGGCGAKWRVEDEAEIRQLADAFFADGESRRNNSQIVATGEFVGHVWWHTIAERILAGASLKQLATAS